MKTTRGSRPSATASPKNTSKPMVPEYIKSIRIVLFMLIVVGICLLITQNMWVPSLVSEILKSQSQSTPIPPSAKIIVPLITPPKLTTLITIPTFVASSPNVQYVTLLDSYHPTNPKPTDACEYNIAFVYPQISGFGDASIDQKINAHLKQANENAFTNTQKEFKTLLPDTTLAQRTADCNGVSDTEFTYKGVFQSQKMPNVLSFAITSYTYNGSAPGAGETDYENYDLTTGNQLSLDDIFISSSNYLDKLSSYLNSSSPAYGSTVRFCTIS